MKSLSMDRLLGVILAALLVFTLSCNKDEVEIIPEENSKTFIYDIFHDWYFWLYQVPELDPNSYSSNEDLVEALMYKELDRWSFVADLDLYKALFEQAETKGYGLGMSLTQDDRLMVRFTYAKAPMGLAGVDRGWEIIRINDVPVMQIPDLLAAFDSDSPVKFTFVTINNDTVEHTMTRTDYKMNTVLHRSVIETAGLKVGYLVFESFLQPSAKELEEAFSFFKQENIDELVVDLRYNGGGYLNIAIYLEELIGGDEIVGKLLAQIIHNQNHSNADKFFGVEGSSLSVNLDRLFFITTSSSASASEMVINGMFPFKEVVVIGRRTHGKPVGMEVFEDSVKYNIALAPITYKLLNANDEGDYFDGIPVDYEVADDIFKAWGDPDEACLQRALNIIGGQEVATALKAAPIHPKGLPLKRGLQEITGAY